MLNSNYVKKNQTFNHLVLQDIVMGIFLIAFNFAVNQNTASHVANNFFHKYIPVPRHPKSQMHVRTARWFTRCVNGTCDAPGCWAAPVWRR